MCALQRPNAIAPLKNEPIRGSLPCRLPRGPNSSYTAEYWDRRMAEADQEQVCAKHKLQVSRSNARSHYRYVCCHDVTHELIMAVWQALSGLTKLLYERAKELEAQLCVRDAEIEDMRHAAEAVAAERSAEHAEVNKCNVHETVLVCSARARQNTGWVAPSQTSMKLPWIVSEGLMPCMLQWPSIDTCTTTHPLTL